METKWRLNVNLLKRIFELSNRPKLVSLDAVGIKPSTWNGWVAAEAEEITAYSKMTGGIPIRALIAVCNELCVPISKMFVKDGEEERIIYRDELVVRRNSFIQNKFDMEVFRSSFGKRSPVRMTVESMMKKMGYTFTVYTAWINGAGNLRTEQLLNFCETFGYDLFSFIVDKNVSPIYEENIKEPQDRKEDLISKCRDLEQKNKNLSKWYATLKSKHEDLKKECEELKVQKSELVYETNRLKEYIKRIENFFPEIAAED